MLEYVLSLYFVLIGYLILNNEPPKSSFEIKTLELAMIIYITYKHPLLGLACAMVVLRKTETPMVCHREKPCLFPVEEQLRAKSSYELPVIKPAGLPQQDSYIGEIDRPYKNEPCKKYTSF